MLSDTSKFSEHGKRLTGLKWQDVGDKTGEGVWGKGKSPRQQSEDLISRTSNGTGLLCDTGQVLPLSGPSFPLLYKEGICLDDLKGCDALDGEH